MNTEEIRKKLKKKIDEAFGGSNVPSWVRNIADALSNRAREAKAQEGIPGFGDVDWGIHFYQMPLSKTWTITGNIGLKDEGDETLSVLIDYEFDKRELAHDILGADSRNVYRLPEKFAMPHDPHGNRTRSVRTSIMKAFDDIKELWDIS